MSMNNSVRSHTTPASGSNRYASSIDDDSLDDSAASSFDGITSEDSAKVFGRTPTTEDAEALRTKKLIWSKVGIFVVLIITAIATAVASYYILQNEDDRMFKTEFQLSARQLLTAVSDMANRQSQVLTDFGTSLMVHSLALELVWPYVTVDDLSPQLSQVQERLGADFVLFCPFVAEAQREIWDTYTQTNQAWLEVSWQYEDAAGDTVPDIRANLEPYSEGTSSLIYAPVWQLSPVEAQYEQINYDSLTYVDDLYTSLQHNSEPTFSGFQYDDSFNVDQSDSSEWPRSYLSTLVYDQPLVDGRNILSREDVAVLHAYVGWHKLFENQVASSAASGMYVTLENTCGDINTIVYRIDGPNVTFLGTQFTPEPAYAGISESMDVGTLRALEGCSISVQVFASDDFKSHYTTDRPRTGVYGVVSFFVTAGLAFMFYDFLAERRQRHELEKVKRSDEIVNSLFPTQVRDRLMVKPVNVNKPVPIGQSLAKMPSTNFVGAQSDPYGDKGFIGANSNSPPIADLYPHATIMFADIANFTAWASVREPTQVFTLLESVYSGFDKLAKSYGVFKVETIGDSYVAAAGLPEARKDHAIVMAKFARECVKSMQDVVRKLEIFLGPETADLEIRVGLHSGPVTAGVLRGEKSRFQLFGDTVNTAARMEAKGAKSKVQVSNDTAEILIAAGKKHWITPRQDLIVAKGKGTMQTYWLNFRNYSGSRTSSENIDSHDSVVNYDELDFVGDLDENSATGDLEEMKESRLINWNVEILTRLLKKIVAMRSEDDDSSTGAEKSSSSYHRTSSIESEHEVCSGTILDEVKEIISLTNKKSKLKRDPNRVFIGRKEESQLRDYVKTVASMYRSNPFHNFEHASHVMQSMTKFISRIVKTDAVDFKDMAYKKAAHHEIHEFSYGITSDPLIEFACSLSALIHDLDHPGVPNAILVSEGCELASQYKNKSVAEQNSVQLAWDLLMEPKYDDLRRLIYTTRAELERFRSLVVNSVMATDIADKELGQLRKNRWNKAFTQEPGSSLETQVDSVNRKATIVIEHLIQAADVAHTMQHWQVYQKWNERLFHEMYTAYLEGRSSIDPSEGWYKGEIGFFDFYIIPLAKKLDDCGVFGVSSDECLEYAKANRMEWEHKGEAIVAHYLSKYEGKQRKT
eukprot:Nitzschia sp. Nitz4//scaffold17_size182527//156864//160606//NITZ4_001879-RA/size182527-snap-gene-0.304-mRNA-1//-1//CDS//3329539415//7435//frame0